MFIKNYKPSPMGILFNLTLLYKYSLYNCKIGAIFSTPFPYIFPLYHFLSHSYTIINIFIMLLYTKVSIISDYIMLKHD